MRGQSRGALYRQNVGRVGNSPYHGRLTPNRLLALAVLFALAGAWLARPNLAGHGLRATHASGEALLERVALVTANEAGLTPTTVQHIVWEGYLFQPGAGEVVFRAPRGVDAKLSVGGQTVYETTRAEPPPQEAAGVSLAAGFHPLRLEITTPQGLDVYYQAGLEWRTAAGWRLTPAVYLYPEAADEAKAESAARGWQASWALAGLGGLLGLALAGRLAWARRRIFATRKALGLAAIVLLALGLRLFILQDLAAPAYADVLPLGSDHRGYHNSALNMLRGLWPQDAFRIQPGMPLALAALYGLLGPNMRAAQIAQMAGGAAATLLVFDLARRTFGEPSGWIAALLWATFPQAIFYEAQFLTHGLEPQAAVLILWLWLRALEARGWRWIAGLGLAVGAAAVLRPTFLALVPFVGASLAWQSRSRWREAAGRCLAFGLAALLPIAPITAWNYRAEGHFQLISGQSDVTLYLGNNRDSTGLGELSPAYRATHALANRGETTFRAQTFADIRAEPGRWLQLMARKTMLYLGDPELPNNVDFYAEGTARSPLLARLPVRFGAMMALGLAGAFLALRRPARRRAGLWILLGHVALQAAIVIGFSSFSRFRTPIYPALAILGGYALAGTAASLRARDGREAGLGLAALAACAALVAAMPWAAERVMSRPIVRELPAASRRLDAPIGEALTLVGYDPLPKVEPGQPVFITLYWQASQPLAADLYATVQVLSDQAAGGKIAQADQALGTGSFPDYPPAEWQPGQIVRDRYLLEIPADAPSPRGLTVLAAAYHRETGERVGERTFGPLPITAAQPLAVPVDAVSVGAQVGTATLAAYRPALDTATLTLTLYWQAGTPMAEDGVVFVHLLDAEGRYAVGQDTRPMDGLYGTQAWQAGEGVVDEHRLPLPADLPPGEYQIAVGMYDAATQVRLPVVDANGQPAPDGVVRLGVIALEE